MAKRRSTRTARQTPKNLSPSAPATHWTEQGYDYEKAESRAEEMARNTRSQKVVQKILSRLTKK